MPVALRLPDIKRYPSPERDEPAIKRLICQMKDVSEEARTRRLGADRARGTADYGARTRSRPRCGSLDDFLNEPENNRRNSGRQVRATRPTQRQPIDDETSVPVEVFDSMLKAAQEARGRATHVMAFSQVDGRPYLRHYDAPTREAREAENATPRPMVVDDEEVPEPTPPEPALLVLPPRPSSSCASEFAGGTWEGREAVAMQVG